MGIRLCAYWLVAAFVLPLQTETQGMVFPSENWTEKPPESQGVHSAKLDAAMAYLATHCGNQGTNQAMVVRNGYVIWKGSDVSNKHNVWSASKSFTSTVLGLLIDDGKATLDTKAKDHVSSLSAQYPNVTLQHFATMTSGYDAVGGAQTSTPFNPADPLFAPGTKFEYWDAAMNQFANVMTRIAGKKISELFKAKIADPIGMNPQKWSWGNWGTIDGLVVNGGAGNKSKGISICATEMARFGHLFLNRGKWEGQQLLSSSWVDQATSIQVPKTLSGDRGPGTYGFNWWVNGVGADGKRKWPDAPAKTYCAAGYNNNKCFVIPEWSMVVVRLGTDGNREDSVYGTFFGMLGEAIGENEILYFTSPTKDTALAGRAFGYRITYVATDTAHLKLTLLTSPEWIKLVGDSLLGTVPDKEGSVETVKVQALAGSLSDTLELTIVIAKLVGLTKGNLFATTSSKGFFGFPVCYSVQGRKMQKPPLFGITIFPLATTTNGRQSRFCRAVVFR